jgi:tetratricopeptide (TPR) repeat protein
MPALPCALTKALHLSMPILLGAALMLGSVPAWSVEFLDYDFSRYSQEITECDRLAAHRLDPGAVAPPVSSKTMNKEAAIKACHAAVEADPDNPRLNYQLGRAYGYSGRGEEAMPYRLKAVAADYPQSLFVIGHLYRIGSTIDQDVCRTADLWRRSARYRRLAALVALPRHYMRGEFDECGVEIPADELRAYLEEAGRMSDDFYVDMLVEDLLRELGAT